jgi:hypothetical protein
MVRSAVLGGSGVVAGERGDEGEKAGELLAGGQDGGGAPVGVGFDGGPPFGFVGRQGIAEALPSLGELAGVLRRDAGGVGTRTPSAARSVSRPRRTCSCSMAVAHAAGW